jgi:hypothetical protein
MATTQNSIVVPQTPYFGTASLAAVTACATRAPTAVGSAAGANIFQVTPAPTNGARIDRINVKACSTSISAATAAATVTIWVSDGTTLWPVPGEIAITVVTPSATAVSGEFQTNFDRLWVPAGGSLWVSTSVTTTPATTALAVTVSGAAL